MMGVRWSRREMLRASALAGAGVVLARAGWRPERALAAPLGPGDRPFPDVPEGTDMLPQIEHIVIVMMENHSFDNYFGTLGRGDGFTIGPDGRPMNTNPLGDGRLLRAFPMPTPCQDQAQVSQNWNATHRQVNGGAMDGFVRTSGPAAMGYWDGGTLPYYWGLASRFPIADRYFASCPAQTYPNRRFLQAGTADGLITTDLSSINDPLPPNGLIWDRLDAHGISYADFFVDLPELGLWADSFTARPTKSLPIATFLALAAAGTLPSVSLVTPDFEEASEENPQDIQLGELFASTIINAVLQGLGWSKTVLVFTYDEHGGYYDHVVPPAAVAPDAVPPRTTVPPDEPGGFDTYGLRVPMVLVSPFAKADYVSHVVHDHTSILRLIETKWNLGALTYRDANASNLLDMIDLAGPPAFVEPPSLPLAGAASAPSTCRVTGSPALPPADAIIDPIDASTPAPADLGSTETTTGATGSAAAAGAGERLPATGGTDRLAVVAVATAAALAARRAVRSIPD